MCPFIDTRKPFAHFLNMIVRQSRNVSLTPELEQFITDRLGTGDYANASEVVRAGLRALRDTPAATPRRQPWPVGGGECGALMRERDWAATPLGAIERWSPALRATVANILNSPVAKVLMWGPEHVMLYNDAYRLIAADRHPARAGQQRRHHVPRGVGLEPADPGGRLPERDRRPSRPADRLRSRRHGRDHVPRPVLHPHP